MPTYEYACKACGQHSEVVQSFTDAPLTECPLCGSGPLRKVYGNIGIAFKGSGFYKNDSRSAKSGAVTGSAPSGDAKHTDSGSGSSDGASSGSGDGGGSGDKTATPPAGGKSAGGKSDGGSSSGGGGSTTGAPGKSPASTSAP